IFRFGKDDILHLCEALELPEFYTGHQGSVFTGIEALMVMLRRLAYPNRLCDLVDIFGRAEPELSIIVDDIYTRFNHLLSSLDLTWLDPAHFAQVIHQKGAPLDQCWGFIDGTAQQIARPLRNQQIMFSGHKRIHCIKFQSVMAPNGLIAHLYGPLEGKRHDAFMLGVSGLLPQLERITKPDGEPYVVYGDPAYGISRHIIAPFRGAHLTPLQQQFNSDMSKVRASVEWGFGKISQYFAYLDFHKNLKVLLQPVRKYYAVGALLANCHTCLYGSVTSSFFELEPPSLEVYLSNN
ncbi:unnamed protein product, partial [Porites lobata]